MTFTLWLLLAALPFEAQEPKSIPKDSVEITARGCLKGRVFTALSVDEDEGTGRTPEVEGRNFRVTGKREVMDIVKKNDGERVEVVGIVRKDALTDGGPGMRIGKRTRVVIGAPGGDPTRMNDRMAPASVAVMDLTAVRPMGQRCPVR